MEVYSAVFSSEVYLLHIKTLIHLYIPLIRTSSLKLLKVLRIEGFLSKCALFLSCFFSSLYFFTWLFQISIGNCTIFIFITDFHPDFFRLFFPPGMLSDGFGDGGGGGWDGGGDGGGGDF